HDRDHGHHFLQRAAAVPLRASANCARTFTSSSWKQTNAHANAEDSPIAWSGSACGSQPGRSCRAQRMLVCGPFRSEKGSLLHHGDSNGRNTSTFNHGAPCDSIGAVWEKVCIDLW